MKDERNYKEKDNNNKNELQTDFERNGVEGALSDPRPAQADFLTSNINGGKDGKQKTLDIHMFQFNSRARAFVAFCRLGLWSGSVALAA
jgi:hypothetical protein